MKRPPARRSLYLSVAPQDNERGAGQEEGEGQIHHGERDEASDAGEDGQQEGDKALQQQRHVGWTRAKADILNEPLAP